MFNIKSSKTMGVYVKNHQHKIKWLCAENSSAKNTHSKLKNGQHADTA
jgi:hypothetical protein